MNASTGKNVCMRIPSSSPKKGYILSFSLLLLGLAALLGMALLFTFYHDNPHSTSYIAENLKLILVRRGVENSMQTMFSTANITLSASDSELGFVQPLPFNTEAFYDSFNAYLNVLNQSDNDILVKFSVDSMNDNLTVLNQNIFVRYPWSKQILIEQVQEPDYQSRQMVITLDTFQESLDDEDAISFQNCGNEGIYCNDPRGMNLTVIMQNADGDYAVSHALIAMDANVILLLVSNHTETRIFFNDTIDIRQYLGSVLINVSFFYPREDRVVDPHLYLGSPKGNASAALVSYKFADSWIADRLLLE